MEIIKKKPMAPCKDCEDRFVGCHSTCTEYQKYKKDISDFNYQVKLSRELSDSARQFIIDQCLKNRRRNK